MSILCGTDAETEAVKRSLRAMANQCFSDAAYMRKRLPFADSGARAFENMQAMTNNGRRFSALAETVSTLPDAP